MDEVFGCEILVNFFITNSRLIISFRSNLHFVWNVTRIFQMYLSVGMIQFSVPLIIVLVPSAFFYHTLSI